ncbi:MAG: hypothetical protein RI935_486 [Candidatus Parcubacteria bacterium]|jgi:hypothetical protein
MIYCIVGTDKEKRRIAREGYEHYLPFTDEITKDDIERLELLKDETSLFGDQIVVHCGGMLEPASVKQKFLELLPSLQASKNIFIVDEPFCDTLTFKKIAPFATVVHNAIEEKKKDNTLFKFADYYEVRDKKNAWIFFQSIKGEYEGEQILGILWWKHKTIWEATLHKKATRFNKVECEDFARSIVYAFINAHKGITTTEDEIEKLLLKL